MDNAMKIVKIEEPDPNEDKIRRNEMNKLKEEVVGMAKEFQHFRMEIRTDVKRLSAGIAEIKGMLKEMKKAPQFESDYFAFGRTTSSILSTASAPLAASFIAPAEPTNRKRSMAMTHVESEDKSKKTRVSSGNGPRETQKEFKEKVCFFCERSSHKAKRCSEYSSLESRFARLAMLKICNRCLDHTEGGPCRRHEYKCRCGHNHHSAMCPEINIAFGKST